MTQTTLSGFLGQIGADLGNLSRNVIGSTASNATLDLSTHSYFELEPTADITIDITGLSSTGRALGIIKLKNGNDYTLTWTAGSGADTIYWDASQDLIGYDIRDLEYNFDTFSVGAEETQPNALAFKPDGTKMYVAGAIGEDVNEYDLSPGWDVSTASLTTAALDLSVNGEDPVGLAFKADGTKIYVMSDEDDTIYQYSLSTAWDTSTGSYDSKSLDVSGEGSQVGGLKFNQDGTKVFFCVGRDVHEYALSTAWDISTGSSTTSFSPDRISVSDIAFSTDGTRLYTVHVSVDVIKEFALSTPFDVSTAALIGERDISNIITQSAGVSVSDDGQTIGILDFGSDSVYSYSFSNPADTVILLVVQTGADAITIMKLSETRGV